MQKFRTILVILIGAVLASGCVDDSHQAGEVIEAPALKQPEQTSAPGEQMYAYLAMNQDGRPEEMVEKIFEVLQGFHSKHPETKILFWNIEKQQPAEGTSPHVFGIWVTYEHK